MTFLGDEGRDVLVAYGILHGHLTLLGPTASVGGFFFGPFYYYFMAPWLLLFHYNPVGPAVGVAVVSIITVWFIYKIGSEFFNITTGLIAAGLYAISPLVIIYSHSSWNPNLMPFFSLLVIYFTYKALARKKIKDLVISGVCLGIAVQLHYIELFLGATVFLFILLSHFFILQEKGIGKKVISAIKSYIAVGIGYIIGWSPFLIFEIRHDFSNSRNIFNFIFHSGEVNSGSNFFMIIQDVFFRIFGRIVVAYPTREFIRGNMYQNISVWAIFTWILGTASVVFLFYSLYRNRHDTRKTLQRVGIAVWLLTEIILFGFYKKNIYDYYFESLFPVPFLLVGYLLSYFFSQKTLIKLTGIFIFLCIIGINLKFNPLNVPPNRQLNQAEVIAKSVFNHIGNKPYNFALITGGNSDHAYRYFLTIWGKPPVTIQNAVVDPQRTSVTQQLIVVCESIPCSPEGVSLWEVAGFGRAKIVDHWHASWLQIYRLEHYTGK